MPHGPLVTNGFGQSLICTSEVGVYNERNMCNGACSILFVLDRSHDEASLRQPPPPNPIIHSMPAPKAMEQEWRQTLYTTARTTPFVWMASL